MSPAESCAYPRTAAELAAQVREAAVDHEAFDTPLKACELAECRATCCHDGVFVSEEERDTIRSLAPLLEKYGISRGSAFETTAGRTKTRTVPARDGELAADFPPHFPRTRCVFLDGLHRCALQLLAVDQGRHPWFWKPISCWMHPLVFTYDEHRRPVLTLARPGSDPSARPGYPGFGSCTPCGRRESRGDPARETLRPELDHLGALAGRRI